MRRVNHEWVMWMYSLVKWIYVHVVHDRARLEWLLYCFTYDFHEVVTINQTPCHFVVKRSQFVPEPTSCARTFFLSLPPSLCRSHPSPSRQLEVLPSSPLHSSLQHHFSPLSFVDTLILWYWLIYPPFLQPRLWHSYLLLVCVCMCMCLFTHSHYVHFTPPRLHVTYECM